MSDAMFSGWGVRTLSTDDRGYNPIGYHFGTVWPHDNSIIALGLARDGFRDEANRIALAQLEAAVFTGYRLPEAFAGFERWVGRFPVRIPPPAAPRRGPPRAPFVFVQSMLGLEARDGELRLDPHVPEAIGRIWSEGCMRSGRSGMSRRSAPKANFAAPRASPSSRPPRAMPAGPRQASIT